MLNNTMFQFKKVIKLFPNPAKDIVFDDEYKMMSIAELEMFIRKYKHLPNVPTELEVTENGMDLAEMNAVLLRQIEELTLRNIEMEKRLTALENLLNEDLQNYHNIEFFCVEFFKNKCPI